MVDLVWATPQERGDVAAYMARVFHKVRWGRAGWDALLANRWADAAAPYAIVAKDKGRIVGAIGQIVGPRPGGPTIHNLTSWYLDKEYRGQGLGRGMMAKAIEDTDNAVTNLSSARAAIPVALSSGMDVLDDTRMVWTARPNAPHKLTVFTDPSQAPISPDTRKIVTDHADLNLTGLTIETPDGLCTLVLSIKQKTDDRITHEVMFADRKDLLSRHGSAIAASILPDDTTILSLDTRFSTSDAQPDFVEDIPVARFCTPGRVDPALVDHLYSEIVILDMKLY
ncbi:GNAT family N-acetyltransferase [Ascidiaceihabitans sp.]|uniref:GNAT family N-acetyltransferase n=1 Tax=Ascidiaceihabitans sp. TaxID=1872644 RepID=UPI003299B475